MAGGLDLYIKTCCKLHNGEGEDNYIRGVSVRVIISRQEDILNLELALTLRCCVTLNIKDKT